MTKLTRKLEAAAVDACKQFAASGIEPVVVPIEEGMTFKQRMKARLVTATGYGMVGMGAMQSMCGTAFAVDVQLTSLEKILDFIGNIIVVVGVVLAGWNVVQVGQQMKETGGLQFNQSVWGVIGGIAMAIGGGAIKQAATLWNYGDVS